MKNQYSPPETTLGVSSVKQAWKALFALLLALMLGSHWSQSAFAAELVAPVAAINSQDLITNTVIVGSTTTDPNALNNTANQSTTVTSEADLQIFKSDGLASAIPGTIVTYTIVVTNAGPSSVVDAVISDTLPAAIVGATWTCSATGGSSCPVSGSGSINTTINLSAGGVATFVVTAPITWSASGTLANTAQVTPPTGTTDPNSGNNSSTDTTNLLTGILTGTVFIDTNGNDVQDSGEGRQNVTVVITTSVGTTFTVITDANGYFTATVPAGNTIVDVNNGNLPVGSVQIAGIDPTTVNVPAGGTAQDLNGYEQQGQVYGHIFEDTDGNGSQNGAEPNLSGISVVITDTFGVTQTVVTDGSGNYTATVPIGNTDTDVVEATLPVGSVQTAGVDPTLDVVVTAGGSVSAGNDGYQRQGVVQGILYMDTNGNGVYDGGDSPLPNVSVIITDSNGVTHTVITNGSGVYSLTVPAGNTTVDVDNNDPDLPSDIVLTGGSRDPTSVNVPAGGIATDDTGYVLYSAIGDTIWLDLNGDGTQSIDEPGLAGVVLTLTLPNNTVITTTSGPNGNYNFSNLTPGLYTVTVDSATLPSGVTQTYDRDGTLNHATLVTILSNTAITDADFGYQGGGSIGDLVWHDLNGNGSYNIGEPGFEGVVITLTFPSGNVITTTTNISGNYSFGGLIAGTYTVEVDSNTLPIGSVLTTANEPAIVNLGSSETDNTIDFGYQQQGQIYGHIFEDTDGNGSQNGGEQNLSGISVVITDTYGVTQTVVTDGSGNYTATVPIGNTDTDVVDATLPVGSVQTAGVDPTLDVVVTAGGSVSAGNDGYQERGVVEGRVYEDRNQNGIYDAGIDQALATVTVVITDSNGMTSTVDTNSLGYFSKTVPVGSTTVNVDNNDLSAGLLLENGFNDPTTVNVLGGATATTSFPYVELTIDLDTTTPTVMAGTQATYTLVIHNGGALAVTNLTISDTLPVSFTYASSSIDASNASRTSTSDPTVGTTTLNWGVWTIDAGGSVTVTFVVNVASSANPGTYDSNGSANSNQSGLIDDVGTVAQDSNTPFGQDAEIDEDVTIISAADLSVTKTDDRDPVVAGTLLTYTISVYNAGPSDGRNVTITDTLPADVTYVSDSAGCGETAPGSGIVVCNLGTVAVGTTTQVTITVMVNSDAAQIASGAGPAMALAPEAPVAKSEPVEPLASQPSESSITAAPASASAQLETTAAATQGDSALSTVQAGSATAAAQSTGNEVIAKGGTAVGPPSATIQKQPGTGSMNWVG